MIGELELTVLRDAGDEIGYVASFALTDQLLVVAGGTSSRHPFVCASSNARHFEPMTTPRELGLRDVLAVGDALWVCGEYGQLACSRDGGRTWKQLDTGTDACLFALAVAPDGAVWVVGERGYAGRVLGERTSLLDFGTTARLASVHVVGSDIVVLGGDGNVYRWREGGVTKTATGATKPLTSLVITKAGTWVLTGDGGFVARSPDGQWFSRVKSGVEVDLEAVGTVADGRVVAVGDRGVCLVSSDDGRTWRSLESKVTSHLWSIERFGGGVVVGGDDGLIVKLAPPGDATWADRVNVFGGAKPLDVVFAAGPDGFVSKGLFEVLGKGDTTPAPTADAAAFERVYGVMMPVEVKRLLDAVRGREAGDVLEEFTLEAPLVPDAGAKNLFERLLTRDQETYLGTGLVEAFCGAFCIGSQGNGDTYHLELYEWDGPRQVLHHDHETHAFTGVIADSLDSLMYLCALTKAHDTGRVSDDGYASGLRKLAGRISPTWHFSIDDPDFEKLDAKRRDTEFFFYRSRWIVALLKNDGVTDVADIPRLFNADFNQVVPHEQLPARFEACEKFIPTALYSMWRAFLFDEPELARYLEIGRRHRSRLVRDAASLIDELHIGGRNELGAIRDMRSHLAAFRALDLDPRRADARRVEAAAKEQAEASRRDSVAAELERTPRAQWKDLAWRWLDDGVAHRALVAKLDGSDLAAQLTALDELRELGDDDREIAVPMLASELAPELEAVLVGSLVRNDRLEDALPAGGGGEDESPGWDAIDRALEPLYGTSDPHAHYGTVVPYMLGGNDPLHGISVYLRTDPQPHFHFVTYGFTDLFVKETEDPQESGFGFELSLRLRRAPDETDVPTWALNFLQNMARYVFGTGNRFDAGHKMGLNGPIALGHDTLLTAVLFADDPELRAIDSPFGKAKFIEVVGITDDEYKLIQEWSTTGLVEILRKKLPFLITDLTRPSVLSDPEIRREVDERVAAEGSSEDLTFAGELALTTDDGHVRIELGALYAAALPRAMRGRLRHGRGYTLRGRDATLVLEPGLEARYERGEDGELILTLPKDLVAEVERRLAPGLAGTYHFDAWPALEIVVTVSFIRDQSGDAVEARGIADPKQAAQLVAAENDEGRDDEDDDGDDDEDDYVPPAGRLTTALAMTERALRLSPDDEDVQFTHAMLLLDAEKAGLAGAIEQLLALLRGFAPGVRLNIATRMGKAAHARFVEVVDRTLAQGAAGEEIPHELYIELIDALLDCAPDRIARLAPQLPADTNLLSSLAWKVIQADEPLQATAVYERLLELPIPAAGHDRTNYLRALNNACVQAHAGKAYEVAVKIADRAQPVAHENPYIYHSAACAYAAVGDYAKAFEQVKLAVRYDYDHLGKVEVDRDLGPILEWPEFKALFRDWHSRQEGN
ncbi:MAG: suppressor of fused domain protein [Deltaproteobacteria bacterium]|nr:suppressor of fused domain protein [Deltaproteobacteria bacterium]